MIVHRTLKAKDNEGNPISGLPDYEERILLLKMNALEERLMDELGQTLGSDDVIKGDFMAGASKVSPNYLGKRIPELQESGLGRHVSVAETQQ